MTLKPIIRSAVGNICMGHIDVPSSWVILIITLLMPRISKTLLMPSLVWGRVWLACQNLLQKSIMAIREVAQVIEFTVIELTVLKGLLLL